MGCGLTCLRRVLVFAVSKCFTALPDGTRFFAASSLDGKGQVRAYETDSGKVQWTLDVPETALYASP